LFPGARLVFSGANEHEGSSAYLRKDWGREVAGVLETIDLAATIEVALSAHPGTKNVVTIGDADDSTYVEDITRAHPELRVWRLNTQRLTANELLTALQTLPSHTIVIFSPFSRDARDRQFTIQQSTRFVTTNSSAPVYALNRYALGYGIVGGKLVDGYAHGSRAGAMARKILNGTPTSEIGIQSSSNRFIFDDAQIRRWNIDRAALPPDSEFINRARNPLREYWALALAALACIGVQAAIIAALVISRRRQRRAQAELARTEARFRQLADAMPQIVWIADEEGQVSYFNRRWYFYTGLAPGEGIRDWVRALHPDDRDVSIADWRAATHARTQYQSEQRLRRADGTYRWHLTRAIPVVSDGTVEWFGTATDIDDQKHIEAALRSANRDLEQFAYSASHDLQEPLRMVSIYSQLLQRRHSAELTGPSEVFLQYILQGASRMEQLLQDLLSYTRIALSDSQEAGESDTSEILDRLLSDLRPRLVESGGMIEAITPMPPVGAADVHVYQLLQNLLTNALKYRSERPPVIRLSATRVGIWWRFAVSDNGIGIAPAYHDRIFGLFRRLHSQSEYAGTGVGLALCKKIVSRYGGEIWVESEEGTGSTFLFTLPAVHSGVEFQVAATEKLT
jgi:PAS domain S-box-containing protein